MRLYFILLIILCTNILFGQNIGISRFNLAEFKELKEKACSFDCEIKTYGNKDFISFQRNDSIITMSYHENEISSIMKTNGNYYVIYEFHPNLNIKSIIENIGGVSQILQTPFGIGKVFDEKGNLVKQIDYENAPYDENIPGPKKTYRDIIVAVKNDFNFDVLKDKSLFGIQISYDQKFKKVNYKVIRFLGNENNILELLTYEYDGETGKFIRQKKREVQLPEGGLPHY